MPLFPNRQEAARDLAKALAFLQGEQPLVLGIPNHGVPIAEVIAEALDASLDILLIAKLSVPKLPGQVAGAVDEHGRISIIPTAARWHHVTIHDMVGPARTAFADLQRRRARFRAILPETEVRGRAVVIVDQGVETGATMLAAIASVRDRGARKVVVAAPAGSGKAAWHLHETADTVVIPHAPSQWKGVDKFYGEQEDFSDRHVEALLRRWAASRPEQHPGVRTIVMPVVAQEARVLHCEIDLPPGTTRGSGPFPVVLFAHSLESDGRSPRTVPVSRRLAKRGVIGVRMDLTGHGRSEGTIEQATPERMLTDLGIIYDNVRILDEVDGGRIGINGSGTGGMIALQFAVAHPEIAALVIRGPLSGGELAAARDVKAPTLLIHAQRDTRPADAVLALDREMTAAHELLEVPESDRWFNDPISREIMVNASVDWLAEHLVATPAKVL